MSAARALHPVAWWSWALGLLAAASATTDPLLLVLLLAVLAVVVTARRSEAPWARGFRYYLMLAGVVIAIRVVFRAVFATGVSTTDHVLFTLPTLHTPGWYAGIRLGGPVSLEAVLAAASDGLRLATLLCCVGAANLLANPKRALRSLPGALYELGVAVVVALTVAGQLVESAQRVRRAQRLRASGRRGLGRLPGIAVPVLTDALERSLRLAAGMDARGYGRVGTASRGTRRATAALLLGGLCLLCLGCFGLLDGSAPGAFGYPALVVGASGCCAALALGGRRVRRTVYRPDRWRAREWVVAAGGLVPAAVLVGGAGSAPQQLLPSFRPLAWPSLPLLPALAILVAAVAALAAPVPVAARRRTPVPPAVGTPTRTAVPA